MDNELPIATDKECEDRRKLLISAGIIKTGNNKSLREELISKGIIDPNPSYISVKNNYNNSSDEGEYIVKPIKTDEEYDRRKSLYLWMVHDILKARKELKLIFKKPEEEPDWYF